MTEYMQVSMYPSDYEQVTAEQQRLIELQELNALERPSQPSSDIVTGLSAIALAATIGLPNTRFENAPQQTASPEAPTPRRESRAELLMTDYVLRQVIARDSINMAINDDTMLGYADRSHLPTAA